MTNHLSEDQIDDVLMGDVAAATAAHLAGCVDCQARVAEVEAPLASFKAVSAAWSERRSATMPVRMMAIGRPVWQRRASWAATVAAVALVGVAIPLATHEARSSSGASVNPHAAAAIAQADTVAAAAPVAPAAVREMATVSPQQPQTAQIERDNEMLQAIDRELDASVESPAVTFGMENVSSRAGARMRVPPTQKWID
jgi:hypothetical protein